MIRCEIFTDPIYNAEKFIEIDPAQIASVEEKTIHLLPRRKFRVTRVTLADGAQHILSGEWAQRIEQARRSEQPSTTEAE